MSFNLKTPAIALISALALLTTTACDSAIYDDEGDCSVTYRVKLSYTKNIKEADAFPAEVTHVSLYAFDAEGHLAWSTTETVDRLRSDDYRINITCAPGTYDIVAWCGGTSTETDAAGWTLAGGDRPSSKSDLLCTLSARPDGDGVVSDTDIHRLYHGTLDAAVLPDTPGIHDYAIDLTKDTNMVRVILQHADGEPVNPEWFTFRITDANTALDHTNAVASPVKVTYRPWAVTTAATELPDAGSSEGRAPISQISSVIAEMTTSRLVTTNRPTLEINCTEPGNEHLVARLDLISYFLMIKGSAKRHYSDQEFLDRQDDYSMMLILDDNNRWNLNLGLYINSWRIVLQDTDLQ